MVTQFGTRKVSVRRGKFNYLGVDVKVAGEKDGKFERIQKELGFDKTRPMGLSSDDQEDLDNKGDQFSSWYQEELLSFYESED